MKVGGYRSRSEGLGRRRTPQVRHRKISVVANGISQLYPLNDFQSFLNRVRKVVFPHDSNADERVYLLFFNPSPHQRRWYCLASLSVLLYSRTRSASESNSCPMRLLFFLHLATLPSMKSKNNPKGMKASAAHIGAYASGGPRQYRMELMMDMKPQKPGPLHQPLIIDTEGG